ncbi:YcnI family protein [Kribbella italica]|uniref:Uncharacterized protein YcnI n=1 Tax=Kribbella italica TaxID=1540520 RepID=A0A7W9J5D6_9ACTN|nr:YcnI family protein [Kribbella italica]MBB5835823.1 uncharacterized protein YcnI [Kribbella italica]
MWCAAKKSTRVRVDDRDRRPVRTRTCRILTAGAAVVLGSIGLATPASAHVIVTPSTTAAGANAVLEFSVAHGCEDSPTTRITIQLPPQITSVAPTRTALWKVEKKLEKLDPPVVDAHGNQIVERVASVTFSTGTPLPDGQREVFELAVQLPEAEGTKLAFPTIQTCEKGESAWIEVPQDGQNVDQLELPAPELVVSAAAGGGHHGAASTVAHSAGAAVAAPEPKGSDPLTLAALAAGIFGSILGGAALVRQRRQA